LISYAVVGHEQRLIAATELAKSIGAVLSVDDGTAGVHGNHCRAWQLTAATPNLWSTVLEDDAEPVPGFLEQAESALTVAPAAVVSLYLGRTRPAHLQHQISSALHRADHEDAHWITADTVLHGVAVAMHSSLRDDWLDFASQDHGTRYPVDELMGVWCRARGHRVAYTTPSLVEHGDAPSLVPYTGYHTQPRKAWRVGTRDAWTSHSVAL
jgi:hypothetical protein